MAESADKTRLFNIEMKVETLVESVKRVTTEISEIKGNLQLSSEILKKLTEVRDADSECYKSFAKFVEDSLNSMERCDADRVVLEIVDILCKYKKVDVNGE